ncbi:MAG TPA: outer membrane protein assembly factor BamD [Candidatus Omnitrophica bacterium]|nr:MAG: hypothetical protein DRP80_02235 [Candidatus Omnitrophota bacterium]HEC69911.1 outer membrane protein assembly factor BamD [Candidatus Omnitrophota bacterium]
MRKILILFIGGVLFSNLAYPFWIWSPKSKKWRNPEYSPLASPQAQLEKALKFYKAKDYPQALKEFKKLVAHFPDAKQAPLAQYYIGRVLEDMGKPYQAFKEYQKVIDSYPYSEKITEIIEREYKIGEFFLNRPEKKWPAQILEELFEHPSIEIFKKVIDNAPYSEYASKSLYKLGLLYKALGRYDEAIKSFRELEEKYPESEWAEPAKYQLALCSLRASPGSDYDQTLTQEAKKRLEELIADHPELEISQQAQRRLKMLRNKEAKKFFDIAQFYYKQREYLSAKVYYEYVLKNYPQTLWAEESEKMLEKIKELK